MFDFSLNFLYSVVDCFHFPVHSIFHNVEADMWHVSIGQKVEWDKNENHSDVS